MLRHINKHNTPAPLLMRGLATEPQRLGNLARHEVDAAGGRAVEFHEDRAFE